MDSIAVERMPYGLLLARLGADATARFRRSLRPLDLGAQQFIVLKQLQLIGPSAQGALADALGIDYSNLADVAGELHGRGLIERRRDDADRRRYVMGLAPDGERLLRAADVAISAGEEDMLSAFGEDDRDRLWELLRRMADSLEQCPGAKAKQCPAAEASIEASAEAQDV